MKLLAKFALIHLNFQRSVGKSIPVVGNLQRCIRQCSVVTQSKLRPFKTLDSDVVKDSVYDSNVAHYSALIKKLESLESTAKGGGGEKAIIRHTQKQKKLLVTDRLKLLLDENSDFLELSMTAGLGMEYGDVPRAGIITGDIINYFLLLYELKLYAYTKIFQKKRWSKDPGQ